MSSIELVNGYVCHNCTDVAYAQRNIDPQHPKDGPFGVNKDPQADHGPAVVLGGSLAESADNPNGVAVVTGAAPADPASASAAGRAGPGIDVTV